MRTVDHGFPTGFSPFRDRTKTRENLRRIVFPSGRLHWFRRAVLKGTAFLSSSRLFPHRVPCQRQRSSRTIGLDGLHDPCIAKSPCEFPSFPRAIKDKSRIIKTTRSDQADAAVRSGKRSVNHDLTKGSCANDPQHRQDLLTTVPCTRPQVSEIREDLYILLIYKTKPAKTISQVQSRSSGARRAC